MQRHRQRGSQAIEFALVLPFLILVIFAVLDFGFLVYNKAIITNASREAARTAVVLTGVPWADRLEEARRVACAYARGALITAGSGTSTEDCTGTRDPEVIVGPNAEPGFNTPVTATVNFTGRGFSMGTWWNLGTGPNSIGSEYTLSATTQMNHE